MHWSPRRRGPALFEFSEVGVEVGEEPLLERRLGEGVFERASRHAPDRPVIEVVLLDRALELAGQSGPRDALVVGDERDRHARREIGAEGVPVKFSPRSTQV